VSVPVNGAAAGRGRRGCRAPPRGVDHIVNVNLAIGSYATTHTRR
jgi:hypothetical protein